MAGGHHRRNPQSAPPRRKRFAREDTKPPAWPPAGLGAQAGARPCPCPPRSIPLRPLSPTNERHNMIKSDVTSARSIEPSDEAGVATRWGGVVGRRSFLKGVGLAGVAAVPGAALFASAASAATGEITEGDVAILRLLAAAELIEADLWQQYAELGGLTPGQLPVETAPFTPMNSYQAAFMNLDSDGPQYITSNTNDEQSHAEFLNAYLISIGADPVDLDAFRTLPSSQ